MVSCSCIAHPRRGAHPPTQPHTHTHITLSMPIAQHDGIDSTTLLLLLLRLMLFYDFNPINLFHVGVGAERQAFRLEALLGLQVGRRRRRRRRVPFRRLTNTAVRLRVSPTVSFRREGRSVAPVHQYFAASNAPAFGKHTYNTATIGAHGSECVSRGLWKRRKKRWLLKSLFARPCVYNAKYLQMGTFSMDPTAASCICCNRSGGISVPEESLPLVRAHVCHLSVAVVLLAGLPNG